MFSKVLWATDLSDASKQAIEYAIPILKAFDSKLYVISVVPNLPTLYSTLLGETGIFSEMLTEIYEDTKKELESILNTLDYPVEDYEVRIGSPYAEIIDFAESNGIELIILGSRGKLELEDILLGSTARKVVSKSKVDTLLVRKAKGYGKLLVCLDASESSKLLYRKSVEFAKTVGMEYTLYHVIESSSYVPPEVERRISESLKELYGEEVVVETYAKASQGIVERSREYDIVAIANRGHNIFHRLFIGSTADKVIQHAYSPVLVFKA